MYLTCVTYIITRCCELCLVTTLSTPVEVLSIGAIKDFIATNAAVMLVVNYCDVLYIEIKIS